MCNADSLYDSKSFDTAIGLGRGVGKRGRDVGVVDVCISGCMSVGLW